MLSFKTALRSGVALAACACSASLAYAQSGPGWSGQGHHAAPAYSSPAYSAPAYGAPCPEQAQALMHTGYAQPHHAYAPPQTYARPVVVHEQTTYGRIAHNRPAASVAYVRTRQGPTPVAIEYQYEAAAEPSSRHVYDTRGSRWR